jgi:hypothetical protein
MTILLGWSAAIKRADSTRYLYCSLSSKSGAFLFVPLSTLFIINRLKRNRTSMKLNKRLAATLTVVLLDGGRTREYGAGDGVFSSSSTAPSILYFRVDTGMMGTITGGKLIEFGYASAGYFRV